MSRWSSPAEELKSLLARGLLMAFITGPIIYGVWFMVSEGVLAGHGLFIVLMWPMILLMLPWCVAGGCPRP